MHDTFDPLAQARAERYLALVAELIPKIRRISPELTEEQLKAAAERMAEYRLADEELGKNAL
jgi:hypothetical protein